MRSFVLSLTAAAALLAGASQVQANTYTIEPTHTFATFEIGHMGTSTNRGRFDKKEGTVVYDRVAKTGKVDITLDITSINTGTPTFDKHLQSPDLFNAAQFPTAKFVSTSMTFNGDKVSEVVGSLTMLGKTNPVTLKATNFNCYNHPQLKREVCGGDFEATLDRTAYGMNFGTNFGVPKDVRLTIQVEAIKQ
jgi:polyisoprenoid-binding protein YceI